MILAKMLQMIGGTGVESQSSFGRLQGAFSVCSITGECGPFLRGMAPQHDLEDNGSGEFAALFASIRRLAIAKTGRTRP